MKIREGKKEDARFLAEVVMEAVGEELCVSLADGKERLPLVETLFATLASCENSQYSYKNSFIAVDDENNRIGGIIAYDGALLHGLRRAFAREAANILGWDVTEEDADTWDDEAERGEIYIDSLYVVATARRQGIASGLLEAVTAKYRNLNKPLGLLVEPDNRNAMRVYSNWGFQEVGISHFFQTPMIHMQRSN